jgi:hypothetical protein
MSKSAAISRPRGFSSVGCHICMSKYLTRKGHTTLSKRETGKTFRKQIINIIDIMEIMYIMHSAVQGTAWIAFAMQNLV